MKKVSLLLILLLLLLTGCLKPFMYDLETLTEEVISAEIVEIDEEKGLPEFESVNKVDDERLNDLLVDLSLINFDLGGKPRTTRGYALKLNYVDSYELICETFIGLFKLDGEFIKGQDSNVFPDDFNYLIQKYIST